MNRTWIYCLITFALGLGLGAFATLFFYPFLFPPAEVNESIANAESKQVTAIGLFVHADPSDPLHWGKGGLEIYKGKDKVEILLKDDFEVGPGPDYRLYLSSANQIKSNDDFENAENFELGRLKSFKGSQVYALDSAIDLTHYNSVVVWCKTFSQLISPAEITQ